MTKNDLIANKDSLFLGVRDGNTGKFKFISEGINFSTLIDLFKPKDEHIVLLDFAPVIETLFSLKNKTDNDNILISHDALYGYWKDSITYSDKGIKIAKCETLSIHANNLMSEVIFKIKEIFETNTNAQRYVSKENLINDNIDTINKYCYVFIDAILCFIHSKASLEINSFKNDTSLSEKCQNLYEVVRDMLDTLMRSRNSPYDSELLQYMLLEKDERIVKLLGLIDNKTSPLDLLINIFNTNNPTDVHQDQMYTNTRRKRIIEIRYPYFEEKHINNVLILAHIIYRIDCVKEMLAKLKSEDIRWESDEESMNEIKKLLGN